LSDPAYLAAVMASQTMAQTTVPKPCLPSPQDAALELALRQSLLESAPKWQTDPYYRNQKENQNDEELEKAIQESLNESNIERLVRATKSIHMFFRR
jgi:hypothetical protein